MKVQIGARIDILRRKRDISIEELSEALGMTHRNLYKIFKKDDLSVSQLWTLSEKLNYNFFELFTPNTTDGPKKQEAPSEGNQDLKKTKINSKEINFCVKYPPELVNNLSTFMMHVDALAGEVGFEVG